MQDLANYHDEFAIICFLVRELWSTYRTNKWTDNWRIMRPIQKGRCV